MKRTLVSLLSLTALFSLFTLTSCQKEQVGNGTQFHATMEGCTSKDSKTALNGTALNWVEGDQIVVYGTEGSGIYTATPQTPATVAVFDNVSGESGNGPFHAFYPATLTTDGVNITLPATQTYVEGSMNEFPMYAESANNQLSFRNLCGVLKLHLTKASTNISTITITTNTNANGTYSIDYNNGDPVLTLVSNGTNTTTLECTTAQTITKGKDFYIYLPATVDSVESIMLTTDNGMTCTKTVKATSHIGIDRNTITSVTLGENDLVFRPIGSKGGLFTINANGDQVWFSQGNLQYQTAIGIWRFAENQYDTIGRDNSNTSATYNGWIDLFGWGTGDNPTLNTRNVADYSTFVDWGTNAISNGGNTANLWRTLTKDEWEYLFNTRTNNTNLSESNARYTKAWVNNILGVILFPDGYTHPTGVTVPTHLGINFVGINGSNGNHYSLAEWAKMEAAGAIFLPSTSWRIGTNFGNVGKTGDYWSSTPSNSSVYYAYVMDFGEGYLQVMSQNYRDHGLSVRLVRDND